MTNEEILLQAERERLLREARALTDNPSATKQDLKRADVLLAQASSLKTRYERQVRLADVMGVPVSEITNAEEHREAKIEGAFRRYVRSGDSHELRTYSPGDTTVDAALIPQKWAAAYTERLKAFVGLREAGATILSTTNGDPYKYPFVDDTANGGERIVGENSAVGLSNPIFSLNAMGAFNYSSQGVLVSNQLLNDSGFDIDAFLQNIFAKRIGRIVNSEFTNGASGGPTGVLPSITNIQPGAAAGVIGLGDLVGLQSIDEGYLPTSKYMFSSVTERLLKNAVGSDGRRIYPEMNDGMLLGYPYVRNNSMPSPASNSLSVAFGSFKFGVAIREVTPTLIVKKERYAELYQTFYALIHRQDVKVTDPNALTVLQQHV
jgi:HK97 family phage major capsid protein